MRNNFKNLDEDDYGPPENIFYNVQETLGIFRYLGQIADIFLPKIVDIVVEMSGGNSIGGGESTAPDRNPDPYVKGPRG